MIIVVDHFSKWAEVEAVQSIITQQTIFFVSRNIFNHFGIPKVITIDSGTQFTSFKFKEFYKKWDIDLRFSST